MSLSIALQNAVSGLHLNQRALDVTAQNVANVNTDGYSRKTISQQAVIIAGQGAGVEIAAISRTVNEFMLKDLRVQISAMADFDERNQFYGRMQDLFGSPGSDTSIGVSIADLATRMQALSASPENNSLMTEIASRAELISLQFNQIVEEIESLRLEADTNIGNAVTTVNTQLGRIQELNIRIAENKALNLGFSELQDQRDIALDSIAELIDINYFERSNGEVVIFTDSGRPLLDRTAQTLSHSAASAFSPSVTWAGGAVDTIDLGGNDITAEINSGAVAGWIALRDTILPDLHSQFEELAQSFTSEINKIHNDGVGFPGLAVMTGTREIAATDTPTWTGEVRVGIVDTSGVVVEFQDFDLATYATVGALITDINAMTNASATINANGNVVIDAAGSNRIAVNEFTSVATVGNETMGLSAFLGLNDLFTQPNNFDTYTTAQQPSTGAALANGTLTFTGAFGTSAVAVTAGDSLSTVAAAINADVTLSAANITASVIADGSGFRLQINDTDGDSFFVADSSTFISSMDMRARAHGVASSVAVRTDIIADPSRISRGELSDSATLAVSAVGVTSGGQQVIQRLANMFETALNFEEIGELPDTSKTLANYATAILSLNATQAQNAEDSFTTKMFLHDNLESKTRAISGVNLDEEMAHMIILESAYSASARVISTTSELFDELINIAR